MLILIPTLAAKCGSLKGRPTCCCAEMGDADALRDGPWELAAAAPRRRGGDGGRAIDESECERNRRSTLASTDRCWVDDDDDDDDGVVDWWLWWLWFMAERAVELAGRARTPDDTSAFGSTRSLQSEQQQQPDSQSDTRGAACSMQTYHRPNEPHDSINVVKLGKNTRSSKLSCNELTLSIFRCARTYRRYKLRFNQYSEESSS